MVYYVIEFVYLVLMMCCVFVFFFFFQAEDGIRDLVRSRGLGDVYKRQGQARAGGVGRDSHGGLRVLRPAVRDPAAAKGLPLSLIHI